MVLWKPVPNLWVGNEFPQGKTAMKCLICKHGEVTARLLKKAAALARDGIEVAVCGYAPAVAPVESF